MIQPEKNQIVNATPLVQVRVAAVGGGTAEVLAHAGITPAFVPSRALGKHMGGELPHITGKWQRLKWVCALFLSFYHMHACLECLMLFIKQVA
jgi:hypothetical protein